MDAKVLAAVRVAFPESTTTLKRDAPTVTLGAPVHDGACEQLPAAGVAVFLADVKGDVSGIAVPGESSDRVTQRARDTGWTWKPMGCPVEFLSLTGQRGAQIRATVNSFGPILLAKVLGLNDT